jgi:two-component system, chemotaxis family, protein-glutamate methylesterase/glutaminase
LPTKEIVCVGGSSGSIEVLKTVISRLPGDFNGSVFIVMHTSPLSPSVLPDLLNRAGPLFTAHAIDRERIEPRRVYVAPPDFHLVLEPGVVRLTRGPKENRFRPAIDPLFRSAASVYGPLAVGVILTGNLDDGVAGLWAIKQLGGTAIVQDPKEALYPALPLNAIKQVRVDHCLPAAGIANVLTSLVSTHVDEGKMREVPEKMDIENRIAKEDDAIDAGVQTIGEPSSYACPECHGVLLQLKDESLLRFRCHTGHAYSAQSLLAEITNKMEGSLWTAVRTFDEGALLMRQIADHMNQGEHDATSQDLLRCAEETKQRGDRIKEIAMAKGAGDDCAPTP